MARQESGGRLAGAEKAGTAPATKKSLFCEIWQFLLARARDFYVHCFEFSNVIIAPTDSGREFWKVEKF